MKVSMQRIFGNGDLDYQETLKDVQAVIKAETWTPKLESLFQAILSDGMSPESWAEMIDVSVETAKQDYDHAYRALKMMADKDQIRPVEV